MQCPKCQNKMIKGFVTITTNTFSYLMTAFTKPYGLFYPEDHKYQESRFMEDGNKHSLAFHCETCKLYVIEDREYNPQYPTPPGFVRVDEDEKDDSIKI